MTMETIETAIRGMQAGMDGIHDMGKTMEKTANEMKEALDKSGGGIARLNSTTTTIATHE